MSTIDRLREQIDACRPGTGDLALSELAELHHAIDHDHAVADELVRSQQFDSEVRAALDDLPVPAGLAERLIAATRTGAPAVELSDRRHPQVMRRRWLIVGGAVALVGLIAVTAYQWLQPPRLVTQEELASGVTGCLSTLQPKDWQPAAKLPKDITIDPAVVGKPRQWQRMYFANSSGWSASVTAIELSPPGAPRVILFVARSSARFGVPTRPTTTTRLTLSRGFAATAWQRQGSNLLYVLVVEEDRNQRLENYLQSGPAA